MSKVDEVLQRPYRRTLSPDPSGGFTVTVHEFPGCVAYGRTANAAVSKFSAAARSWVESALETGYPIAEPAEYDGCSGKIALRVSRRIHQMASERAEMEGTSVNQLLATAIAHYLGQLDGLQGARTMVAQACDEFARNATWFIQRTDDLVKVREAVTQSGVFTFPEGSGVTWEPSRRSEVLRHGNQ